MWWSSSGQIHISDSSSSGTYFIHLYTCILNLLCSNFVTALLPTPFITTSRIYSNHPLPPILFAGKKLVHGTYQNSVVLSAQKSNIPHCDEILFFSFWDIIYVHLNLHWEHFLDNYNAQGSCGNDWSALYFLAQ